MKKRYFIFPCIVIIVLLFFIYGLDNIYSRKARYFLGNKLKYYVFFKTVKVPNDYEKVDENRNGVYDPIDMVNSARNEVKNKTKYKDGYYKGGYPPAGEGVCTDVIWRAFLGIGVDFKDLVEKDIEKNLDLYPRIKGKPDKNIDFRRVTNLNIFLKRNAISLTTEIKSGDVENLREWQPGDILIILEPYGHIGIVSDKRGRDGVPYIIHNTPPNAREESCFDMWNCKIARHYRWKYSELGASGAVLELNKK